MTPIELLREAEAMEAQMHNEGLEELGWIRADIPKDIESIDVRLCFDSDATYHLNTGDMSFDTHHGTACGVGTLEATASPQDRILLIRDLVEQVIDQLASWK